MAAMIVIALMLATLPAASQDFQKGSEAYKRGAFATALDHWQRLAARGNAVAQNNVGTMYQLGQGTRPDPIQAANWYRKSADQGLVYAQTNLALMYLTGVGVGRNFTQAAKWYHKAAKQGNADAQFSLANLYRLGIGVAQNDVEAVKWYRLAAQQGLASAQSNLGYMYHKGKGVTQDHAEAVKWYRLAARQGLAAAQSNLGLMHQTGKGVARDYAEAMKWYRMVAERQDQRPKQRRPKQYPKRFFVASGKESKPPEGQRQASNTEPPTPPAANADGPGKPPSMTAPAPSTASASAPSAVASPAPSSLAASAPPSVPALAPSSVSDPVPSSLTAAAPSSAFAPAASRQGAEPTRNDAPAPQGAIAHEDQGRPPEAPPAPAKREAAQPGTQVVLRKPDAPTDGPKDVPLVSAPATPATAPSVSAPAPSSLVASVPSSVSASSSFAVSVPAPPSVADPDLPKHRIEPATADAPAPQKTAAPRDSVVHEGQGRPPEAPPAPAKREAQPETQVVLRKPDAQAPTMPNAPARAKPPTPAHQFTRLVPRPVAPKPAVKPEAPATESKIAAFRDWMILAGRAEGERTCSLVTLPRGAGKERAAADAPHVRVPHALSSGFFKAPRFILGERTKPGSKIVVVIDKKRYRFDAAKGSSELTVKNGSWQFLRNMIAGIRMKVRFTAWDGAPRSLDYSLLGFTRAFRRTKKECRAGAS
jgi:TPR repeat protein